MDENEDTDLLAALIDAFDSDDDEPLATPAHTSTTPSTSQKQSAVPPSQRPAEMLQPKRELDHQDEFEKECISSSFVATKPLSAKKTSSGEKASKRPMSGERVLEDFDIFNTNESESKAETKLTKAALFGDMDSDDEENDMVTKSSLNENGMELKKLMNNRAQQSIASHSFFNSKKTDAEIKNSWVKGSRMAHDTSKYMTIPDIGIRVLNPKVSLEFLKKAMVEKDRVTPSCVNSKAGDKVKDWITFGVVASKTETKRSASDKEYIILRLVDMTKVEAEVTLFLFGPAYTRHWKTPVASVIGLMNPNVMKNDKSSRSVGTISIMKDEQLMVIGTSKDFGTCGSLTKNGNKCNNIVNRSSCDKCRFHMMKEHKGFSKKRAELNTAFGSLEPKASIKSALKAQRGGEDIFYGGQSFSTAPKPKPKTKVSLQGYLQRSSQRGNLQSTLNLLQIKPEDEDRIANSKQIEKNKAERDLEDFISKPSTSSMHFMKHLMAKELKGGTSSAPAVAVKSITAKDIILQEREKKAFFSAHKKKIESDDKIVVLDSPAIAPKPTQMSVAEYKQLRAKQAAIQKIKQGGGIKKEDKNCLRKKLSDQEKKHVKRKVTDSLNKSGSSEDGDKKSDRSPTEENKEKKRKLQKIDINSEEYLAIRNAKSSNTHLIKKVTEDRNKEYFNTLEKKESYESKLLDTHFIEAIMFFCPQCDYQDWKPADRCKTERHNVRTLQVLKRFFKCNNCKDRFVTHERFPTSNCRRCGGTNFTKAGMINEKKVSLAGENLSLRGNEESKLGNYDSSVNLDIS